MLSWRSMSVQAARKTLVPPRGGADGATAVVGVQHVPEERVQNRDGEQTVVVPLPQIMDAIGKVTQRAPERRHSRVVEQMWILLCL